MPAGRALWLLPEDGVRARLASLIRTVAARHGTPAFEPHLTLCAGIALDGEDARARTERLARETAPLGVILTTVATTAEYYRAVVLDVGGDGLAALHARAAGLMATGVDPAFRPHLSLAYGFLTAEARDAIVREVGPAWNLACRLDALALVRVDGDPADWTAEQTFALTGS